MLRIIILICLIIVLVILNITGCVRSLSKKLSINGKYDLFVVVVINFAALFVIFLWCLPEPTLKVLEYISPKGW